MNSEGSFSAQFPFSASASASRQEEGCATQNCVKYPLIMHGPNLQHSIVGGFPHGVAGSMLDHDARVSQMRQIANVQLARIEQLVSAGSLLHEQLQQSLRLLAEQFNYEENPSEATEPTAHQEFVALLKGGSGQGSLLTLDSDPLMPDQQDFGFLEERRERRFTDFPCERYLDIEDFFNN